MNLEKAEAKSKDRRFYLPLEQEVVRLFWISVAT